MAWDQFRAAWSCSSFPEFLWGCALLLPLLGGSWLILGCAVDHQWRPFPVRHVQHCRSLPLTEALNGGMWPSPAKSLLWGSQACVLLMVRLIPNLVSSRKMMRLLLHGCRSVAIFMPCIWKNFKVILSILNSNPYCFLKLVCFTMFCYYLLPPLLMWKFSSSCDNIK